MSGPDITDPLPESDDALAAEFVLGVLSGAEQAVLARRVETDPAFARAVWAWEERLSPMAQGFAPEALAPATKRALDLRLFGQQTRPGVLSSLAFWRGIAAASAVAFVMALTLPALQPAIPAGRLAASLTADGSEVAYIVVYDAAVGSVSLAHMTGAPVSGRDFQLWVAKGADPPVSLGVIPAGASTHVAVTSQIRALMTNAAHMAISLEPQGGSPTGQPTGPVLAVGNLLNI